MNDPTTTDIGGKLLFLFMTTWVWFATGQPTWLFFTAFFVAFLLNILVLVVTKGIDRAIEDAVNKDKDK